MNKLTEEFLRAIKAIADEKKIPRDAVADALKDAIIKAYTKECDEEVLDVQIDIDNKICNINRIFTVVDKPEDEINDYCEISVHDANAYLESIGSTDKAIIGGTIAKPLDIATLDKKIVLHIMQIFKQGITVKGNLQIYSKWKDHVGEVVRCEVERSDRHGTIAKLEENEYGFIGAAESIPGEQLIPGNKYNFLIKEVKQQSSGWPVIFSRADANLVKFLLKVNVPEIQEGIIEIKDIQRVAGFKTKVSLFSHQPSVEPCGTVIGPHGSRIQAISNEIHGEKIDVFEYSDDFEKYLVDVCSPAQIKGYSLTTREDGRKELIIIIKPEQMALLIGKRGANIRLISMLLNADIDVRTPEDAKKEGLNYKSLEVKSMRERKFDRVFQRNSAPVAGDLSSFAKPNYRKANENKSRQNNNTNAQSYANNNNSQVNKTKFASLIKNSASLSSQLEDQMAKFNLNDINDESSTNEVETKVNEPVTLPAIDPQPVVDAPEKPTTVKKSSSSLFDKLKAAEAARINAGGSTAEELEENAKKSSSKKTSKKPMVGKFKKPSIKKSNDEPKVKTSILDELASGQDKESLMNEIKQEINDYEEENEDLNSDVDDLSNDYYDDDNNNK